jgi:cyanophycinase
VTAKRVMAIGGAEDRENECEILKEFVRLAGGEDGEILIMTVATHEVGEMVKEYRKVFRRLACRV